LPDVNDAPDDLTSELFMTMTLIENKQILGDSQGAALLSGIVELYTAPMFRYKFEDKGSVTLDAVADELTSISRPVASWALAVYVAPMVDALVSSEDKVAANEVKE
jgi:hypothetical protein